VWDDQALRHVSFSWLPNIQLVFLDNIACCIAQPPKPTSPDKRFCLASKPSSRAGGELGRPYWPSSAQLPDKEVSEHFAHGLPHFTDTAGLSETFCLACMQGFREGGALGGPGQQV